MKRVKQEQKFGCVFACIAMILESDYWTVRNDFPVRRFSKNIGLEEGISTTSCGISYLFHKGYVGHSMYSTVGYSQRKMEIDEWVKEFAPVHIVSLVLNGYNHAVVLKDGIVYDPFREGKYTLSDYGEVNSITGFWKINNWNQSK
jgi:hypothetical protein